MVHEFKIGLWAIGWVNNNSQTMMWELRELSGKQVRGCKLFSNQIAHECYGQERFKHDKLENICSKKGMIFEATLKPPCVSPNGGYLSLLHITMLINFS